MRSLRTYNFVAFGLAAAAVGCATPPSAGPPETPAALRAPADQVLHLEARAAGVQIYEGPPQKTDKIVRLGSASAVSQR